MKYAIKKKNLILIPCVALILFSCSKPEDPTEEVKTIEVEQLPTYLNVYEEEENILNSVFKYSEDTLYTLNKGELIPCMAKNNPVDVSKEYISDSWDIISGDVYRAFRIDLRDDLKYADGSELKAIDFVESIKNLLNPDVKYEKAASLFKDSFKIYNAQNYYERDDATYYDITDGHGGVSYKGNFWSLNNNGSKLPVDIQQEIYFNFTYSYFAKLAINNYHTDPAVLLSLYTGCTSDELSSLDGMSLYQILKDSTKLSFFEKVLTCPWCMSDNMQFQFFCSKKVSDVSSFNSVGFFVDENYANSFVFILQESMSPTKLANYLTNSFYLTKPTLYSKCFNNGKKYGSSIDDYMSFGPYKVSSKESDKITLIKNDNWYGYSDETLSAKYSDEKIVITTK